MNKTKLKPPVYRMIFALLSIFCMIMIFCFSCEDSDASSDTSGTLTKIAVSVLVPDFDSMTSGDQLSIMASADHIIRKFAHFSIYAALGFFISCTIGKRRMVSYGSAASVASCFIYACSDELHQYFVPGRSCQFTDVLIDTSGSITGMLISIAIIHIISTNKSSQ